MKNIRRAFRVPGLARHVVVRVSVSALRAAFDMCV